MRQLDVAFFLVRVGFVLVFVHLFLGKCIVDGICRKYRLWFRMKKSDKTLSSDVPRQ